MLTSARICSRSAAATVDVSIFVTDTGIVSLDGMFGSNYEAPFCGSLRNAARFSTPTRRRIASLSARTRRAPRRTPRATRGILTARIRQYAHEGTSIAL